MDACPGSDGHGSGLPWAPFLSLFCPGPWWLLSPQLILWGRSPGRAWPRLQGVTRAELTRPIGFRRGRERAGSTQRSRRPWKRTGEGACGGGGQRGGRAAVTAGAGLPVDTAAKRQGGPGRRFPRAGPGDRP